MVCNSVLLSGSAILWPFIRHIPAVEGVPVVRVYWRDHGYSWSARWVTVYSVHANCNLSCYDSFRFLLLLDSKDLGTRLVNACRDERWKDALDLIQSGKWWIGTLESLVTSWYCCTVVYHRALNYKCGNFQFWTLWEFHAFVPANNYLLASSPVYCTLSWSGNCVCQKLRIDALALFRGPSSVK